MNAIQKAKRVINYLSFEIEEFKLTNKLACSHPNIGCCNCMDLYEFLNSRKNPEKVTAEFAVCSLFDQISYEYFHGSYAGIDYSYRSGWYKFFFDYFHFPKLYQHNTKRMGHPIIFFKIAENEAIIKIDDFSYAKFWQHYSDLFNLFCNGIKDFIEKDFSSFYMKRKISLTPYRNRKLNESRGLPELTNKEHDSWINTFDYLIEWETYQSFLLSDIEKEFPSKYLRKIKKILEIKADFEGDLVTQNEIALRHLRRY